MYIVPEVDRALERRAAAEGITKAEPVRRVLATVARLRVGRGIIAGRSRSLPGRTRALCRGIEAFGKPSAFSFSFLLIAEG